MQPPNWINEAWPPPTPARNRAYYITQATEEDVRPLCESWCALQKLFAALPTRLQVACILVFYNEFRTHAQLFRLCLKQMSALCVFLPAVRALAHLGSQPRSCSKSSVEASELLHCLSLSVIGGRTTIALVKLRISRWICYCAKVC